MERKVIKELRPVCNGCGRSPLEIDEYCGAAEFDLLTPDDYVRQNEGTYNPKNGHFWCTDCYIREGMPIGKAE